ncbi:MAG TPA: UdgX family uracil-DNA binding protein [Thermoanaerobaculia bacterium]|nr:UdgX family uracil-DNA binding protein [Thermoanaerobaculia bacterium]
MRDVVIRPTLESWRAAARILLAEGVVPEEVVWREAAMQAGLFEPEVIGESPGDTPFRVPRAFVDLAAAAARHSDPERWRLLYSVLWKIIRNSPEILASETDPDLTRLKKLARHIADADLAARTPGAAEFVPKTNDLEELRRASLACRGCDLYRDATQTVFGKGPPGARAVFVGEAPGDQEDIQGAPFVGPAGEVFDRALVAAGLPRGDVYVTNAVKHFKFVRTPKRRIHQTPGPVEIGACRPWLEAELAVIRPEMVVCLGGTAAKSLLGADFRIMKQRGQIFEGTGWAPKAMATLHPSAVLRAEDAAGQERLYGMLVADLALVARTVAKEPARIGM